MATQKTEYVRESPEAKKFLRLFGNRRYGEDIAKHLEGTQIIMDYRKWYLI